jgi:hypothetical protein
MGAESVQAWPVPNMGRRRLESFRSFPSYAVG